MDYFCADDLNKQQANSEARLAKTTFCAFMGAVSGARFPPGFCGRRCVIHGISRKQKMSTGPDPCGSMRIHRDQRQNMQVYSLTKTIAAPSYAWSPRSRATKNPARIVPLLYSRVTIQLEFQCAPVRRRRRRRRRVRRCRRPSSVVAVVVAVVVVVVRRRPGFRLRKRFQI